VLGLSYTLGTWFYFQEVIQDPVKREDKETNYDIGVQKTNGPEIELCHLGKRGAFFPV